MRAKTLGQAAQLMDLAFDNFTHASTPVTGVAVDSRLLQPGQLFFAIPGAQTDGHHYLEQVAAQQAAGAVVSISYKGPSFGLPLVRSENPLLALQQLARADLAQRRSKVIAITGSVGKTTTKDFVSTLLSQKYKIACTPGNSNSQIGMPLALLNHTEGNEDFFILEMGMTHPGNIAQLTTIAPPFLVMITQVALVHAANFHSLEEIADTKGEILDHPATEAAFLCCDHPFFLKLSKRGCAHKIGYSSVDPKSDFYISVDGDSATVYAQGEAIPIGKIPVPGEHNRVNLLAAIACARYLEMSWEQIKNGLRLLKLPERRLEVISKRDVLFVNDSYNASEISLKAALKSLPNPAKGGRTIAVLGEMLELGKFSEECHLEVAKVAASHVDAVLCIGEGCAPIYDHWNSLKRPVFWVKKRSEEGRQQLTLELKQVVRPGDVVLLKGSRSNQLWKILEEV